MYFFRGIRAHHSRVQWREGYCRVWQSPLKGMSCHYLWAETNSHLLPKKVCMQRSHCRVWSWGRPWAFHSWWLQWGCLGPSWPSYEYLTPQTPLSHPQSLCQCSLAQEAAPVSAESGSGGSPAQIHTIYTQSMIQDLECKTRQKINDPQDNSLFIYKKIGEIVSAVPFLGGKLVAIAPKTCTIGDMKRGIPCCSSSFCWTQFLLVCNIMWSKVDCKPR